jgi:hypothetical protein
MNGGPTLTHHDLWWSKGDFDYDDDDFEDDRNSEVAADTSSMM